MGASWRWGFNIILLDENPWTKQFGGSCWSHTNITARKATAINVVDIDVKGERSEEEWNRWVILFICRVLLSPVDVDTEGRWFSGLLSLTMVPLFCAYFFCSRRSGQRNISWPCRQRYGSIDTAKWRRHQQGMNRVPLISPDHGRIKWRGLVMAFHRRREISKPPKAIFQKWTFRDMQFCIPQVAKHANFQINPISVL